MTVHEHFPKDGPSYIHDHRVSGGRHLHDDGEQLRSVQEDLEYRVAQLEGFVEGLKVYVRGDE